MKWAYILPPSSHIVGIIEPKLHSKKYHFISVNASVKRNGFPEHSLKFFIWLDRYVKKWQSKFGRVSWSIRLINISFCLSLQNLQATISIRAARNQRDELIAYCAPSHIVSSLNILWLDSSENIQMSVNITHLWKILISHAVEYIIHVYSFRKLIKGDVETPSVRLITSTGEQSSTDEPDLINHRRRQSQLKNVGICWCKIFNWILWDLTSFGKGHLESHLPRERSSRYAIGCFFWNSFYLRNLFHEIIIRQYLTKINKFDGIFEILIGVISRVLRASWRPSKKLKKIFQI